MQENILLPLKRYVQTQYDHSTWGKLMELSGLNDVEVDHQTVCPNQHVYDLVGHAAEMTGLSAGELHEKFGEYLVPDLMYMYQKLVKPEWKALDMIEHTEATMHKQVRHEHAGHTPPVISVKLLVTNKLIIDYVSPRRMSGLAVGTVRGLAVYSDEADRIDVLPTTSEEGEGVSIHVRRN